MIQVDEYAAAIFFWLLAAIVSVAQATQWQSVPYNRTTTVCVRSLWILGTVALFALLTAWTIDRKVDKSWTNLKYFRAEPSLPIPAPLIEEPAEDVRIAVDNFPLPPILPPLEIQTIPSPTQPKTDPSSPIPYDQRPSKDQARIEITSVVLDRMQPNPVFFFQLENLGGLPSEGFVRAIVYVSSARPLTDGQISAYQDQAEQAADFFEIPETERALQLLPRTINPAKHTLLSPGRRMVPGDPSDHTADWLKREVPEVLVHRRRLYFFVAIKYRDRTMPANVLGLTESCGYFASTFETRHDCARRRSILIETSQ